MDFQSRSARLASLLVPETDYTSTDPLSPWSYPNNAGPNLNMQGEYTTVSESTNQLEVIDSFAIMFITT